MFITVEGIDGCGKTTQLELLAEWLREQGEEPVLTREPGGTWLSEEIRRLLLRPGPEPVSAAAELLLYAAARAEHVARVIRPALAAGRLVLADRYSDSTLAYQVAGRGLERSWAEAVLAGATGGLRPDLTFLFDLAPERALARAARADRLEQEDLAFFERVRAGYMAIARAEPERVVVIDSNGPVAAIQAQVRRLVAARLAQARREGDR
ncbi:MAG: dTMP kinase [Bacillota bacterium]|nr:dTMP kinase [Bacillota bacterium]